ncbi:proline iminopeptidase-family hydrolase [Sphingomonas rhizophila]|uniref:Proline iminopeptidase-family hydrolase n=1 Tax=Sphingomonas rhizophila TaxID=2071607 RepID=A0A7G9S8E0_9SPHN|nr:proline iminopeptidase-family hydrolase [Sphingomonas rhizophila]QNN64115.1 proline iminopeptidase-family hydrolase [Sphingomonas rhizophila]
MRKLAACLALTALALGGYRPEAKAGVGPAAVPSAYLDSRGLPDAWSGGVRMIPIKTPKGDFRVWVKRVGNNPKLKLLLLHGGPGATHDPFQVFDSFLPQEGIEYYYYDQLGSGRSDRPNDDDLWTVDRFVSEVEQVRSAIGADASNFCLLGQSWGGLLAMEYALKHQDQLKCLVVSNMMASIPAYNDYANRVLKPQMDPAKLKIVEELERTGKTDDPRYLGILMPEFYEKHILRRPAAEWPEPVVYGLTPGPMNQHLYVLMQGPSEMGASGRLANWDRFNDLKRIAVPTLVISGKHDTMDPTYMARMASEFPKGELLATNGGHMAMYDDQPAYFAGLTKFLRKFK